jgi:hypothetical protein
MWEFRSSINKKQVVTCGGKEEGRSSERLVILWHTVCGQADAWAANFLRKRFF